MKLFKKRSRTRQLSQNLDAQVDLSPSAHSQALEKPYSEQNLQLSLREIQQVELGILLEFDALCKKHGLRYWIGWGTLLGALRHKGFIPWDNDVDAIMPLDDYFKLIELAAQDPRGLISAHHRVSHHDNDPEAQFPFIKIYDMRTHVRQHELKPHIQLDEGVWLDIFPIAGRPENESEYKRYAKKLWSAERVHLIATIQNCKSRNALIGYLKKCYGLYADRRGYRHFLKKIAKLHRSYPIDLETSENIMSFCELALCISAKHFRGNKLVEFEGHYFPAPLFAEELLDCQYGNWRELPCEEERYTHEIDASWRSLADKHEALKL